MATNLNPVSSLLSLLLLPDISFVRFVFVCSFVSFEDDDRPVALVTRDGMTIYHGKNLNPDKLIKGARIFTVIGDVTFIGKEDDDDKVGFDAQWTRTDFQSETSIEIDDGMWEEIKHMCKCSHNLYGAKMMSKDNIAIEPSTVPY